MIYVLQTSAALILALTVRFIAGSTAAIGAFLAVLAYSLWLTPKPGVLLILSATLYTLVRSFPQYSLHLLNGISLISLTVLIFIRQSLEPAGALLLIDAIALTSLAYRGWSHKRLLD